ncbi:hypothetical protein F5Y07DRAFT_369899 [Xylaria sp. FL0933]|nr:hypothetical protein F5Y07DRAFT_369899 [Xylaria sp. FL0933]
MSIRLPRPFGFARFGHFWMWLLASGSLIFFSAISLRYLYFESVFCGPKRGGALPGECFYFLRSKVVRLGIEAHLWCVLPAGILAGFQFIPAVHRPPLLRIHRVIGYSSIILALVGSLAALPLIRHAFGGDLASQASTGLLLVLFVVAQIAGYVCIKRRNIQDHRRWMLRSWFYAGSVITMRIIMIATSLAITSIGGYYLAMPCAKINSILKSREETLRWYPECSPYFAGDVDHRIIVDADVFNPNRVGLAAAFNLSYGMSAWLAIVSHAVGVEFYIQSMKRRATNERAKKSK